MQNLGGGRGNQVKVPRTKCLLHCRFDSCLLICLSFCGPIVLDELVDRGTIKGDAEEAFADHQLLVILTPSSPITLS